MATITEALEFLDNLEEEYFGKEHSDHKTNIIRDGQVGTLDEYRSSPYDEDWEFKPYENQEEAKNIHNSIEYLREYLYKKKKERAIAKYEAIKDFEYKKELI